MNLYAIDKVAMIEVSEKSKISERYKWLPEIKSRFFGITTQRSGFYIKSRFSGEFKIFQSKVFDEPEYVIKNENKSIQIFTKPYVSIKFVGGQTKEIYFESSEELLKFVEEIRATYARIFNANLIEEKQRTS